MKFFYKNIQVQQVLYKPKNKAVMLLLGNTTQTVVRCYFAKIVALLFKCGLRTQYNILVSKLVFIFFYERLVNGFYTSYNLDQVDTFLAIPNFHVLIQSVVDLVKPPFVIQTSSVPKKLKRKIGLKYLVKIVYKNELSRSGVAIKQIINNANLFGDCNFPTRLYKSVVHTFFEGKTSILYKKKLLIFKKFFKL